MSLGNDFQVGDSRVSCDLNQIERFGEVRKLEPKVMEVLYYLAANGGTVLSKERILQAVWPDTFVGEKVLTYSIGELRKALDDDARNPAYIETIPRRGYG